MLRQYYPVDVEGIKFDESRFFDEMPCHTLNTAYIDKYPIKELRSHRVCATKSDETVRDNGIEAVVAVGHAEKVRIEIPTTAAKDTRGFNICEIIINK